MKESYRKDLATHPDPESCDTGALVFHRLSSSNAHFGHYYTCRGKRSAAFERGREGTAREKACGPAVRDDGAELLHAGRHFCR